jgi:hypothetical protein
MRAQPALYEAKRTDDFVPPQFTVKAKTSPLSFDWNISAIPTPNATPPFETYIGIRAYVDENDTGSRFYVAEHFNVNATVTYARLNATQPGTAS